MFNFILLFRAIHTVFNPVIVVLNPVKISEDHLYLRAPDNELTVKAILCKFKVFRNFMYKNITTTK